jgi:hypothetical protein
MSKYLKKYKYKRAIFKYLVDKESLTFKVHMAADIKPFLQSIIIPDYGEFNIGSIAYYIGDIPVFVIINERKYHHTTLTKEQYAELIWEANGKPEVTLSPTILNNLIEIISKWRSFAEEPRSDPEFDEFMDELLTCLEDDR